MDLPDWNQTGLPDDLQFKADKSMHYWQKFPPEAFIETLYVELGQELSRIREDVRALANDTIVSQAPEGLLHNKPVARICEMILHRIEKSFDVLDVAHEYARFLHVKSSK